MTINDLDILLSDVGRRKMKMPSVKALRSALETIKDRMITWCEKDFEGVAITREEAALVEGKLEFYDRSKFSGALLAMVRQHDASLGITWDTIDTYLDECAASVSHYFSKLPLKRRKQLIKEFKISIPEYAASEVDEHLENDQPGDTVRFEFYKWFIVSEYHQ